MSCSAATSGGPERAVYSKLFDPSSNLRIDDEVDDRLAPLIINEMDLA